MADIIHLSVENLSFSYPGKPPIVADISLHLQKGERVGVVGPNGSGKTTFFLLLTGILKPQSGMIMLDSKEIRHNRFNPQLAYLFQDPADQLFSATVFDDIIFGPVNMKMKKEDILKKAEATLDYLAISHLKDKPSHHLSGGEKRLAALATLVSMSPGVYLLDEPVSNLDIKNRRNIINILNKMEQTLLISSHDLEFLLEVCDRVILIDEGKIIADGPIREIFKDDALLTAHHLEKPHSLTGHSHRNSVVRSAGVYHSNPRT